MAERHMRVTCDAHIGPLHVKLDELLTAHWTVLFGPSGSGKSTVLRLLAGLWVPSRSSIQLCGRELGNVPAHRRRIGFVAQQTSLFPHLSVRSNVAFGCANVRDQKEHVSAMLERFGLLPLSASYPAALSGGEQQRVALARTLAANPQMVLLDEAFTGMHRKQQQSLIQIVREYSIEHEMTVLSVTHDVAEALLCADEVLRMEAGHIFARGTPFQVLAAERETLVKQLAI